MVVRKTVSRLISIAIRLARSDTVDRERCREDPLADLQRFGTAPQFLPFVQISISAKSCSCRTRTAFAARVSIAIGVDHEHHRSTARHRLPTGRHSGAHAP